MFLQTSFRNLLFPVASPGHVKQALPWAKHTADSLKAKLTVMRVIDPFDGGPKPVAEELRSLDPEGTGLDQHPLHLDANSDAASSIAHFARVRNFDAILVPPGAPTWLNAFSRNWSVTRRLMSASPCPVWLLPKTIESKPAEVNARNVLCAVTGRDLEVVKMAGALSQRLNARLFLLHVIPEIHEGTLAYGFDNHISLSTTHAMHMLADLQEKAGVHAEVLVQTGSVGSNIRKAAEQLRAGLLVTGRPAKQNWLGPLTLRWSVPPTCQTVAV